MGGRAWQTVFQQTTQTVIKPTSHHPTIFDLHGRSVHSWADKLMSMGHNVRLMAPQFVKPYVKTNKHDAADAICEVIT